MSEMDTKVWPFSFEPGSILGYKANGDPIYPVAGGAEDTDDGTEDENEDESESEDDDENEDDDKDTEFEPPSKEEWERTRKALKKANADAKRHRLEAKTLKQKSEGADESALRQAREDAASEVEGKYKPIVVKAVASSALVAAGLKGKPDRFLRMLDMDEIDVDEDGDVIGLDDQIKTLREDYAEFFDHRKKAPKADRTDRAAPDQPKTSAERIAANL